MSHIRPIRVGLIFFILLPFMVTAQEPCGNIITREFGETDITPIEDCNNPFSITEDPTVTPIYSSNEQTFESQATLTIDSAEQSVPIQVSFESPEVTQVAGRIFKHDGQDLVQQMGIQISRKGETSLQLTVQATGTYTFLAEALFPSDIQPVFLPTNFLDRLKRVFVPVAYAQSDFFSPDSEIFARTFTVALADSEPTGASSVLFLPGIQASRLYAGEDIVLPGFANNIEKGDKLWEQTNDKRIAVLAMNENGESLYNIYTDDVVEEVTGRFFGANIYKGFLGLLDGMKVEDGGIVTEERVINDFVSFAYDWRYSVFDVATKPVQYENEVKLLKDELIELASTSLTDKVTIIAHSNGGLVAKALLHEYGDNELKGLVDKVVMIGTPQLGTPKGISALLHGQVMEGFGNVLTSDVVLRDTIANMSGTYTLLPSTRYLDEVADVPLVRVPAGFPLSVYDGVSTRSELDALLLDSQNVVGTTPTIQEPMQLNDTLLTNALAEQAILDAWRPPAGVEVYEVAGTGIPTPAAVHYEVVLSVTCPNAAAVFLATQCETKEVLKPKLYSTIKGDKTVVLGSARGQLGDKRALTVNLNSASEGFRIDRDHSNLTETPAIQTFVESVIRFPYLTDNIITPPFSQLLSGYTIHAGHSPVTLRVTTPGGLVTGIVDGEIRQDISGSQFLTLAGSSYVIVPDDVTDYTLEVIGTGNGVYTLETSTLSPDDVQTIIASFVASTTDTMMATMEITDGSMGTLQTDFDNNGSIDEVRTSAGGLVVAVIPELEPDPNAAPVSPSSATRVGERAPAPAVLGLSVSADTLTPEQYELLRVLLTDIQQILQGNNLTATQLAIVSSVLTESLLIVTN